MEQNVLITGASRGLGRRIAGEFAERGATLAIVSRDPAALEQTATELRRAGARRVDAIPADLSDPCAADATADRIQRAWEHLDVLVNNAAILGPIGPSWENDWAEWQRTMQVNLLSPVALCRRCIPLMRRGGAIVNLSGGGATSPRPNFSAYGASKAALVRFTETLAQEVVALGIRVNAIAPGVMNTQMLEAILHAGARNVGKEYDTAVKQNESGGDSAETAAALVCYLVSSECEAITGRLISAVWDPWRSLSTHGEELSGSDIYTLRRVTPEDRGREWR